MARYCKLLILFASLCFASCQEGREAGDLLGQWRLAGSDMNYLSFSGSVALFRNSESTDNQVYGNFQHKGDSLFIQCYSAKGKARDTLIVEDYFGFKPFNDIRLKVVTLDRNKIILTKDGNAWAFEKY